MYFLLGLSLIFAFFVSANLLASVFATISWRVLSSPLERLSAQNKARVIFGLRVYPVAVALFGLVALLIPAYILFEPEASGEVISLKLGAFAIVAAAGAAVAGWRLFRTLYATRRMVSDWTRKSEKVSIPGINMPVYRLDHRFPVLAVVGILRPRIFVADRVFNFLDEAELRAAITHEYGHLKAFDNLKRTVLRACRDLLIFPFGRALERAWAENAEVGADEFAARESGGPMGLDLAGALVKVARLVPQNSHPSMPAGAFLLTGQTGDVTARVHRLFELAESGPVNKSSIGQRLAMPLTLIVTLILLTAFLFTVPQLLLSVHNGMEWVVALLQ